MVAKLAIARRNCILVSVLHGVVLSTGSIPMSHWVADVSYEIFIIFEICYSYQ